MLYKNDLKIYATKMRWLAFVTQRAELYQGALSIK